MTLLKRKIIVSFLLVMLLSLGTVVALPYHHLENNTLTITFSNFSDGTLNYKRVISEDYVQKNFEEDSVKVNLSLEEPYEYYVTEGFFDGRIKVAMSNRDEVLGNLTREFARNQQTDPNYCMPYDGEFSCLFADMNALEAERFALAYEETGNKTYLNFSLNLTFADYWYEGTFATSYDESFCDHSRDDFDCGRLNFGPQGIDVEGSYRQGTIITSFFRIWQITGNDSIRYLAEKYAKGSASDCDVWSGDFSCTSSRGQGSLGEAYWLTYLVTGNETYRTIAENLLEEGKSYSADPNLMIAFARGYEATGDESYKNEMQRKRSVSCNDCSPEEVAAHIEGFLELYKQTADQNALQEATKYLLSGTNGCDPISGDFQCDDSWEQGRLNTAYWVAYRAIPEEKLIARPYVEKSEKEVNISFYFQGLLENLTLHYMKPGDLSFEEVSLDFINSTTTLDTGRNGLYKYYIKSETERFPAGNGTFIVGEDDEGYVNISSMLFSHDPKRYCKPNEGDYSCQVEDQQGWMMQAFVSYLLNGGDAVMHLRGFANSLVDDNDIRMSTCEYIEGDYSCENRIFNTSTHTLSGPQEKGSLRQGTIATAFTELYRVTLNSTYAVHARRYLENNPEDCNPWAGDYSCEEGQEAMAYSYWKGYEVFGDKRYLNIARNLTEQLSGNSSEIAKVLWYGKFLSGEYREDAVNITDDLVDECSNDGECSIEQLSSLQILLWNAVKFSEGDENYLSKAMQKSFVYSDPGNCIPARGDLTEDDYECKYADQQGMALSAYSLGARNFWNAGNITYSVKLDSDPEAQYMGNFTVRCNITNTGNYSDSPQMVLNTGLEHHFKVLDLQTEGVFDSTKKIINFTDIPEGSLASATWVLRADKGGVSNIQCVALPEGQLAMFSNRTTITVDNIFDVLEIKGNKSYWFKPGLRLVTYEIKNKEDFSLSDVNISIAGLEIYNFTGDSFGRREGDSFIFDTISPNSTQTLNVTYDASFTQDYIINISVDTRYGGLTETTHNIHVYNNSIFSYDLLSPSIAKVKKVFNITLNLTNSRNFTMENISVMLSGLSLVNISYNDTNIFSGPKIKKMEPGGNEIITWSVFSDHIPEDPLNFGFLLNSTYPDITQSINGSVIIGEEGLFVNLSSNLPGSVDKGQRVDGYVKGSVKNIVEFNLSNVSINAEGMNVTLVDANNTYYVNYSDTVDNSTVNMTGDPVNSSANITFDYNTTGNLVNMTLNLFADSNYTVHLLSNESYFVCDQDMACIVNTSLVSEEIVFQINASDTLVENVTLDYVKSFYRKIPVEASDDHVMYDSLEPGEEVFVLWSVSEKINSDTTITVGAESGENAIGESKSYTVRIRESSSPTSSSSGGGGGYRSEITFIQYNYSDYNITEAEPYLTAERLQMAENATYDSIDCLNVTRGYDGRTELRIVSWCNTTYVNYTIYDNVSVLDELNISSDLYHEQEKDLVKIVIPDLSEGVYNISYESENHLTDFSRPVIFGFLRQNISVVENETILNETLEKNETDQINSTINETVKPDEKNATIDLGEMFAKYKGFFIKYKTEILYFFLFVLAIAAVVLIREYRTQLMKPFVGKRPLHHLYKSIKRTGRRMYEALDYYIVVAGLKIREMKKMRGSSHRPIKPGLQLADAYIMIKQIEEDIEKSSDEMNEHYEELQSMLKELETDDDEFRLLKEYASIVGLKISTINDMKLLESLKEQGAEENVIKKLALEIQQKENKLEQFLGNIPEKKEESIKKEKPKKPVPKPKLSVEDLQTQLYFTIQKVLYLVGQEDHENAQKELAHAEELENELKQRKMKRNQHHLYETLLYPLLMKIRNDLS